MQASACVALGCIATDEEKTEESAQRAMDYFERALKVYEVIRDDDGITNIKQHLVRVKSLYKAGSNNVELKVLKEFYELRVKDLGENHNLTIRAGMAYAITLHHTNHRGEACELLTKMHANSKQVFGLQHTREAFQHLIKMLAAIKKVFGPEHIDQAS